METTPTVMGRRGACDIEGLTFTTGGDAAWFAQTAESNYGGDAAQSGDIDDDGETWMETTVEGQGTLTFWYKLSCDANDGLNFFTDGQYRWGRAGNKDWDYYSYVIYGSGSHTVRWSYTKDSTGSSGSDCAWVDHIQWSGDMPDPNGGEKIAYVYDPAGRRIEKQVDGATQVKHVYDGDNCIAEYDGSDQLLRKYVYGPRVDQPVCLIESASGTIYYYHFDGLGSVVALTNSTGSTVQLYEYSAYGQVAASDPNHPNRFLFTGREFNRDTGLYYYRARYYHPEIGRFLQTDPIGYTAGVNLYTYCGNNPLNHVDPSGEFWGSLIGGLVGGAIGGISGGWGGGWTGAVSGAVGGAVTGAMIGMGFDPFTAGALGGAAGSAVNVAINQLVYGDVTVLEAVGQVAIGAGGGAVTAWAFPGGDVATGFGVGFFSGGLSIVGTSATTAAEEGSSIMKKWIDKMKLNEYAFEPDK